jgi:hypothetical protein
MSLMAFKALALGAMEVRIVETRIAKLFSKQMRMSTFTILAKNRKLDEFLAVPRNAQQSQEQAQAP